MSEPLAERMRPRTLDDYVGQQHLIGEGAVDARLPKKFHRDGVVRGVYSTCRAGVAMLSAD